MTDDYKRISRTNNTYSVRNYHHGDDVSYDERGVPLCRNILPSELGLKLPWPSVRIELDSISAHVLYENVK